MRRVLPFLIALLLCIPALGQSSDRQLVEESLSAPVASRDTSSHRFWHLLRHQISGSCKFETECIDFYPQAVHQLGPVRGTLAYFDRVTRCSRVGTASYPQQMKTRRGRIREDAEAYRRRRGNAKD